MERLSEIMCYEIKAHDCKKKLVTTPLGKKDVRYLDESIVDATILEVGLTVRQEVFNYFNKAENAFIRVYREKSNLDGKTKKIRN